MVLLTTGLVHLGFESFSLVFFGHSHLSRLSRVCVWVCGKVRAVCPRVFRLERIEDCCASATGDVVPSLLIDAARRVDREANALCRLVDSWFFSRLVHRFLKGELVCVAVGIFGADFMIVRAR